VQPPPVPLCVQKDLGRLELSLLACITLHATGMAGGVQVCSPHVCPPWGVQVGPQQLHPSLQNPNVRAVPAATEPLPARVGVGVSHRYLQGEGGS